VEALEGRLVPAAWSNLNDAGPGSLRQAIADANSGDTILADPSLSGTIKLDSTLELKKSLTINDPNGRISIIQDPNSGGAYFRLFTIDETYSCELDNLWIGYGGGISNAGYLTLNSCTVASNQYDTGAGIGCYSGTLTLCGTVVTSNTATGMGGGIYASNGKVYCYGSQITYNRADTGGGIALNSQTAYLNLAPYTTVSHNTATTKGGGIYDYMGTVEVSSADLSYNTAGKWGGGLYSDGNSANVTFTQATITYNTVTAANGQGGGFYLKDGTLTFNYTTISNNQAATGAGGAKAGGTWSAFNCTITDPIVNV
jgi:predicted outer membrane repeat protein